MGDTPTERLQGADAGDRDRAVELLQAGKLVAIPTETVYGLAGRSDCPDAIWSIFEAKRRDPDRALSVLSASFEIAISMWREGPWLEPAHTLAQHFWPGPLTLVCPARPHVDATLRGGTPNVGLRSPNHPIALDILRRAGVPLAAPSANISEKPSPTSADAVAEQLSGTIAAIVDGGPTPGGLESTIVALHEDGASILRAGAIGLDAINAHLSEAWTITARTNGITRASRLMRGYATDDISIEIYLQGAWHAYSAGSVDALIQGLHEHLSRLGDGERSGAAWRAGRALRNDRRFDGVCYLMDRYLRTR